MACFLQLPGNSSVHKCLKVVKIFILVSVISELQATLAANDKRLTDLKQLSLQLEQNCKLPCKDTVTIQTVTGKGTNQTRVFSTALV